MELIQPVLFTNGFCHSDFYFLGKIECFVILFQLVLFLKCETTERLGLDL